MTTNNKKETASKAKKEKSTSVDRVELGRSRTDSDAREDANDMLAMFSERKEAFRNTYGNRGTVGIPAHRKNKNLHYVKVPTEEVGNFLDQGYLIDTSLNGTVSDEMIGRANKTGSVPDFGLGQGRMIVMVIPKEWKEEREKAASDALDAREKAQLGGHDHRNVGISGSSKQVDV